MPRRVWILGSRNTMIVSGTRDQRMSAVARRQRGRLAREQLHAVGLSDGAIQHLVRRGGTVREHPSVYVIAAMASTPLGPETGALLSLRDEAVLSYHSAAALWAIGAPDRIIHISLGRGGTRARSGVQIHRTGLLAAQDVRIHDGLPVTSPARTLLDSASATSMRVLERMFTEALTLKIVTPAEIQDVVDRAPGAKGRGALQALLDAEDEPARLCSDSERRMLALIRRARLPAPLTNQPLHGFNVDFYWPAYRVVVEVDSYGFHTTHWAYERDRSKDAVLRAEGMPPLRFSRRQILKEPLMVIAQIAGELAAAGAPPPSTPSPDGREAAAR